MGSPNLTTVIILVLQSQHPRIGDDSIASRFLSKTPEKQHSRVDG